MRRLVPTAAVAVMCATALVQSKQQPPAQGTPAQSDSPQGTLEAGRGRGRGGPEVLAGGPQLNDPAYANVDFSKKPPVLPLTPDQELKRFILQPGYRLELVLADPDIQEPTAIAFDGNARMSSSRIAGTCRTSTGQGKTIR